MIFQSLSPSLCLPPHSLFKDLTKFMKGELKGDAANVAIRNMIAQGIEKVELRDEIYCQLIRQTTCNPNSEYCQRVWSVFSLCTVSFGPSHTLNKVRTAWNKCILMRPLKFLNTFYFAKAFELFSVVEYNHHPLSNPRVIFNRNVICHIALFNCFRDSYTFMKSR